ncbi:MAG: Copper amine oxidase, domain, partial [Pseudonocardiales bacterium]|nr:Copper amine oxidase, domain [Pseudonocardiales bacterium]
MTTQVLTEPIEEAAVPQPSHPLDPLSADEVAAAVAILQAQVELTPSSRYVMISLAEPPKPAD